MFESEFCYRVWKAGYQVALVDIPVKRDDADRGTMLFNEGSNAQGKGGIRQINCERNIQLMKDLYTNYSNGELKQKIKDLNEKYNRRN